MTPVDWLVTTRLRRLDPRARRVLFRAVERAEAKVQLFHRHRAGGRRVPHPIALTPFVVRRRLVPTLARLADCVHRFQAEAPRLYHADAPGFRYRCPLGETSRRWLDGRAARPSPWALMIRPDVGLDDVPTAPGGARPVLFETNATALAGLYNHAAGVAILEAEVFHRLLAPAERRRLTRPPDLLALTVRWVVRAARRLGCPRALGVAFLEEAGPVAGYSEIPRLMRAFRAHGVRVAHGTPADLTVRRGAVYLAGVRVDIAYRDLAYEEVGPPPAAEDGDLAGFRMLSERGAVVPGFAGEFGHKGLLECLTDPAYARLFAPTERRLLAACVPWTRVLGPRFTTDRAGRRVDLAESVRRDRTRLLIKPNVGSSGEGVLLGGEVTAARWERRIDRALRKPGAWVVQERRPGTRREMAYLRDGAAYAGPCFVSLGLFYAPGDLGLHCRVSRAPVVNVARGGALACAFLTMCGGVGGGVSDTPSRAP